MPTAAWTSTRRRDHWLARLKGLAILAAGLILLDLFNKLLLSPIVAYAPFTPFYKFLPPANPATRSRPPESPE